MGKPTVTVRCPANHYAGPHERIVEFSDSHGNGGLISLRETEAGKLSLDIYRCNGVSVRAPKTEGA